MSRALNNLEILDWREAELARVAAVLKDRLHELILHTDAVIEDMPTKSMLRPSSYHDEKIAPVVENWIKGQRDQLRQELEGSAKESEEKLGEAHRANLGWSWNEALGAGAGAAMTVAPLAAIPFLGVLAMGTTTSFLVFTSATISVPVLAVGAIAIGAAHEPA